MMSRARAADQTRPRGAARPFSTVSIALFLASVFGLALLLLGGRLLDPAVNKTFLSLWGVVFGLGSVLSAVEQEVSRLSAQARLAGQRTGPDALRTVAVGMVCAGLVGALQFIPAVSQRLYAGDSVLAVVATVGGVSFAVLYGVRGLLIGHERIGRYAGMIVTESASRLVVALLLAGLGVAGLIPLSIAVVAGTMAWLVFLAPARRLVDREAAGAGWGQVSRTTVSLMASLALASTVIISFPATVSLLAPAGDAAAVGAFLAALTLARFPLILLLPVQTLAVPAVVRMSSSDSGRRRLHGWLVRGAVATAVLAVLGGVAGMAVGPWVVRLAFRPDYVVAGWAVGGLVLSSTLIAALLLLVAVLVAWQKANLVLAAWGATAGTTAALLAWWPADTVVRAVVALIVGPLVGLAIAFTAVWRRRPTAEPGAGGATVEGQRLAYPVRPDTTEGGES